MCWYSVLTFVNSTFKISGWAIRSTECETTNTSPKSVTMKENETNESESTSEPLVSERLSSKELQKVSHERRRDNIRRHSKTKNNYGSWDLSGGLLGI